MRKILLFILLCSFTYQGLTQCGGLTTGDNDGPITITGNCVINGNVVLKKNNLSFSPGASLTINGNFDNDGNGTVNINNATFITTGYFSNNGNGTITVQGDGTLDVGGYYYNDGNGTTNFLDGTISIDGNFTNDGNGTIAAGGTVTIGGDFSNTGNGDLTVSGGLNVEGDVTSSGNGSIIIEDGGVLAADDISVSGGTIEVEGGGTIYSETGNITGTVNNDPTNGDQVCSNNCCGANCNTSGDGLSPTAQETLPVTLLYFKAEPADYVVELSWSTATEFNTSHFEIYRSDESGEFYFLEEVPASGNSKVRQNYSCIDISPTSGLNLYQLVSVDFDGYREAFSVQSSISSGGVMKVFPNPSDGIELNVSKPASLEAPSIRIHSLSGQVLFSGSLLPGQTKIKLENALKSGLYILTLQEGDQIFSTQIAVK